MRTFELRADEGTLTLAGDAPTSSEPYGDWSYDATLEAHALTASARIYDHLPKSFSEFFLNMARDWSGWEGERVYESLEHSLRIIASHDRFSKVTFSVELRSDGGYDWSAKQKLSIEPGRLEEIAKSAIDFSEVSEARLT